LRYLRTSLIRCALAVSDASRTRPIQWSPRFQMLKGLRKIRGEGRISFSMLPGFRFLFAAIVFSMSVLVFGLGAAALLRTAHEQFASNPSWHAAPEANFAQQAETTRPVLAMLRFEPPAAEQKTSADIPAANVPAIPAPAEQATNIAPAEPTPVTEPAVTARSPAEPEMRAAPEPEPPAAAKTDMALPESPAPSQAATAPSDTPTADATTADATNVATPASGSEARVATAVQAAPEPILPPPTEAVPAPTEVGPVSSSPANPSALPESDISPSKIATLDSPSATVKAKPPVKTVSAKPDRSAVKKRLRAQRAAHRRQLAARAARQARLAAQQATDPFGQTFAQPAAAARSH
jgi:hypothetical protein